MAKNNLMKNVFKLKNKHEINLDVNISLRNQYVFFMVCKAASSTVTHHLQSAEYRGTRFKVKDVNDAHLSPHVKLFQLGDSKFESILTDKNYKKITFVRNPYSRVLSCYLHRIVKEYSNPSKLAYYNVIGRELDGDTPTFKEFLEFIFNHKNLERHWAPQTSVTLFDYVHFDFIGKVETIEEDLNKLDTLLFSESSFHNSSIKEVNKAPMLTNATGKLSEYYTPELIAMVNEIYADDFKNFGYKMVKE